MPFQAAADIPAAVVFDPGEPIIAAPVLAAMVVLLVGLRRAGTWARDGDTTEE
jgi:hypothetical protein